MARHIRDLRKDDLEEIVTDDRGMFEDICSACRIHKQALTTGGSVPVPVDDVMTADGIRIRYYQGSGALPWSTLQCPVGAEKCIE